MDTQIIKLDASELRAIPESKADQIKTIFEPMSKMLAEFEESYEQIMTDSEFEISDETCKQAKKLRLEIAQVRINTENARKAEKEEHLRAGKAVDGVANILKWAVTDKENKLKDIENHFELKEKQRLNDLQAEREAELEPYITEDFDRPLSNMADDVWQVYFENKKRDHADRLAAEETARKVQEAQEKEDADNLKRVEEENKKLKDKADAVAAEQKIKDDAIAAEQKKKDAAAKVISDENERLRIAENQRRLDDQNKADQLEKKRLDGIQAELSKGDTDKIEDLRRDLRDVATKYEFEAEENKLTYRNICLRISTCLQSLPEPAQDEDVGI